MNHTIRLPPECSVCPPIVVPGPIIPFAQWSYYHPGPVTLFSGTGFVPPLTLWASGQYGMSLDNGYCEAHIDTLNLTVPDGCDSILCDYISGDLYAESDGCNQNLTFTLYNSYGTSLPYTITSSMGSSVPSSGTLGTGGNSVAALWYPPIGFTAATITFYVTVTLPDSTKCTTTFSLYLECPYYGNSPSSRGGSGKLPDGSRNLTAAPNPAQNSTVIAYRYPATNEGGMRTLEVYDMTGRRLAAHTAGSDVSGKWTLPLDGFAAGIYQVIMKQDGRVLETARLSITH